MRRLKLNKLNEWQTRSDRMPLLLLGARQVGKTWLLKEFGKQSFEDVAYFSFDQDPDLIRFFDSTKNPARIIEFLSVLQGHPIIPGKTLLILDEIQDCNSALNALKYFCETMPDLHVAASGSFLGVSLSKPAAFPVGKVNFLRLFPMSFDEFLIACEETSLLDFTSKASIAEPLPDLILHRLMDLLRNYWLIGGMPAVVNTWIETKDLSLVEQRQSELLLAFERDFTKHAEKRMVPKIWQLWDSIPAQLAKENKKFQYAKIHTGGRAKEFEDALNWLLNTGLVYKVPWISKPGLPHTAYEDGSTFKLYFLDVGLLRSKAQLPARALMKGDSFFTEFKGSLVENFVAQELIAHNRSSLHYWTSNSDAEVDFILNIPQGSIPIEVKSGESVRSKSLRIFLDRYKQAQGIRLSPRNLRNDDGICNIPLSMISHLERIWETVCP